MVQAAGRRGKEALATDMCAGNIRTYHVCGCVCRGVCLRGGVGGCMNEWIGDRIGGWISDTCTYNLINKV